MARPVKPRFVENTPSVTYFKPRGIPLSSLEEVVLKVEELEAIKLKDLECLEQEECAKRMNISRATFQRILNSAKKKIADALVNGKAIKIEGGYYKIIEGGLDKLRGRNERLIGGRLAISHGPPNFCVCPVCGNQQPKIVGLPCSQNKCNKCGSLMMRGK